MATYLELCQESLRFSDTGAPGALTSLRDADDYHSQITRYVADAWRMIQSLYENWGWMRREIEFELRDGISQYKWSELRNADAELAIPPSTVGFRNWVNNDPPDPPIWWLSSPDDNHLAKAPIAQVSFELMRQRRLQFQQPNQPVAFAIHPDKTLEFHQEPDKEYRIYGMHVRGVQSLTEANEIPYGIDAEYHNVIVWRTVMILHGNDTQGEQFLFAQRQYEEQLNSLTKIHLPTISVGGALV